MPEFESKPYDGEHPLLHPGNDWRDTPGLAGLAERASSYGNWGGPGNRALAENRDYVEAKRKADPKYDETTDPVLLAHPEYLPIDGIDAAAMKHDAGYDRDLGAHSMYGWEGMRSVREDDRALVAATHAELEKNGDRYSPSATGYAESLQGFFGTRVMGMDAMDWTGDKAGEAWHGVGRFIDEAKDWSSLGDVGRGLGNGLLGAGAWAKDTAGEAWHGLTGAASRTAELGRHGLVGTAEGVADLGLATAGHLADGAWDGIRALGHGAAHLFDWLKD